MDLATRVKNFVTLGDSVNWGQGLRREHKFSEVVYRELLKAHPDVEHYQLAHSGAIIGAGAFVTRPPEDGEVPIAYPSILQQLAAFSGDPQHTVAVLLNGGINDIDIRNILSPWVPRATLHDLTVEHCFDSMRTLLRATCERFPSPKTPIVVTPYYPILSKYSSPFRIPLLLANVGLLPPADVEGVLGPNPVVDRCIQFWEDSQDCLKAAIIEVNTALRDTRVRLAEPGFSEHNAAFSEDPWLFGLKSDGSAEDEIVDQRVASCNAAIHVVDILARQQCYRASAGHPNAKGASKYADAVLTSLALG